MECDNEINCHSLCSLYFTATCFLNIYAYIYSFCEKLLISGEQMDASTYSSCHGYSPAETVFGRSLFNTLVTNKIILNLFTVSRVLIRPDLFSPVVNTRLTHQSDDLLSPHQKHLHHCYRKALCYILIHTMKNSNEVTGSTTGWVSSINVTFCEFLN